MMSLDISYYHFLVNDALWYNILELQMTSHMSSYKMMLSDFFCFFTGWPEAVFLVVCDPSMNELCVT
jgi:hypothetical protein